jgi:hypothetical protein
MSLTRQSTVRTEPTWYFRAKSPDEKIRNPIQGEFFATDAIEGPAQALVRESIQNSLDARAGAEPVEVRIRLRRSTESLDERAADSILEAAWPHVEAKGNGLKDPPGRNEPCGCVIVEDFGTAGLEGDPAQYEPDMDPKRRNAFFLFVRAEGLSGKGGTELGRWGVGKFVFPRSSRASMHFAVTVRKSDRRRLLIGAATLKSHYVSGDQAHYTPDGLYGIRADNGLVLPVEDSTEINRFCELFGLARGEAPGLSVLVPFPDPEITEDLLLRAVIGDYFWPILAGQLVVSLALGGKEIRLERTTIGDIAADESFGIGADLRMRVALATAAMNDPEGRRIMLPSPPTPGAVKWSAVEFSSEFVSRVQSEIDSGQVATLCAPLEIRPKGAEPQATFFDIHVLKSEAGDGKPTFVREGIVISDVKTRRTRGYAALVCINDKPLATLLGDSENPAHTQWQKDGSNFRGQYTYGKAVIDYVVGSVSEVLAALNRKDREADPTLTIDFFSLSTSHPDPTASPRPKPRGTKAGKRSGGPDVKVDPRPARIRIERQPGGFVVLAGPNPPDVPCLLEIRCAYDVRVGDPLRKWTRDDFCLNVGPIRLEYAGDAKVITARDNRAAVLLTGPQFRVEASGFDTNKDLYVRTSVKEIQDAGQAD